MIPSLPNRDWKQSSFAAAASARRGNRGVPGYVPDGGGAGRAVRPEDLIERTGGEAVRGGLQRVERDEDGDGDIRMKIEEEDDSTAKNISVAASGIIAVKVEPGIDTDTPMEHETLEQQALRAVLATANNDASSSRPSLSIALQSDTLNLQAGGPPTESDAFRQDVLTRPEESTMSDYETVPIESFGEALLRGMGWVPGKGNNPGIHNPKRRTAGLGLGAKEKPVAESKGGKDGDMLSRAEKDRKRKEDWATRGGRGYVPVIKRVKVCHQ